VKAGPTPEMLKTQNVSMALSKCVRVIIGIECYLYVLIGLAVCSLLCCSSQAPKLIELNYAELL
jgi:hypothetical protein